MKTVLITGASSGFGKLLTEQLSTKTQYTIIATMRNTNTSNSEVKKELEKCSNVTVIELDVTSEKEVNSITQQILQKYQGMYYS